MFEVIRWVSFALMWLATGLNTVVFIRGIRLNKRLEAMLREEASDEES